MNGYTAPGSEPSSTIGTAVRWLGFAGLLPQLFSTGAIAAMRANTDLIPYDLTGPLAVLAMVYPLVILSFLGGIWWGFAVRRDRGQAGLAAVAVLPSLVAVALLIITGVSAQFGWGLVATGTAVMLTLPVDRHLVVTHEAPAGWMALRVPLSLGLGTLTIVAGALVGSPATLY